VAFESEFIILSNLSS